MGNHTCLALNEIILDVQVVHAQMWYCWKEDHIALMIQLTTQRNIQFSFYDMMYKIHSLHDP